MSRVWQNAPHSGGELLTLLAIADFADDQGVAWPSVAVIARKTRLSPRQVNRVIVELKKTGWLSVIHGAGRHKSNRYKIIFGNAGFELLAEPLNPDNMSEFPEGTNGRTSTTETLTPTSEFPEDSEDKPEKETLTFATETLTPTSRNPDVGVTPPTLLNHQEPSMEPPGETAAATHESDFIESFSVAYEKYIGPIDGIANDIANFVQVYRELHYNDPPVHFSEAVSEAVNNNVRSWSYINAILTRWMREGKVDGRKRNGRRRANPGTAPGDVELQEPGKYSDFVAEYNDPRDTDRINEDS